MDILLPHLPDRSAKPRVKGITMMMDKGLGIKETEDIIASAGHLIDYAKLGFGTSYVLQHLLKEKVALYKQANIKVYLGGTFFEAFLIRNKLDEYLKILDKNGIDTIEISDGSIMMDHDFKCEYIRQFSANFCVLSEVGSKDAAISYSDEQWVQMMQTELQAGSTMVIAEARESGTVGIYESDGKTHTNLIDSISKNIDIDKILWEAPLKSQQIWFIKHFGCNVNLGNIASNEIVPLETLRLGLRGDTFFQFLPEDLKKFKTTCFKK